MRTETKLLQHLKRDDFLIRNNITLSDFRRADMSWDVLLQIGISHTERTPYLKETAILLSSMLQQVNEVHSVRWRIKQPEHLMAKIIRKRNSGSEKYNKISVDNYQKIVTDLIGIRVLHLFKKNWQSIHHFINTMWRQVEQPIIYLRTGDESESDLYSNKGCRIKLHDAGYRSAHYVIKTRPIKDEIFTEIQVRTIFEEGWSEIDHRIRYPDISDDHLINHFLMIFNRLAGSADEMGAFIFELKETLNVASPENNLPPCSLPHTGMLYRTIKELTRKYSKLR